MNSTDFIRLSLDSSQRTAMGLLVDLKDSMLTPPAPSCGNHALWTLGHLAFSESILFESFVCGKQTRFPDWKPLFGIKSVPSSDASVYPQFEEMIAAWNDLRADVLRHLSNLDDADLSAGSHAPAGVSERFGSVGQCFAAMVFHPGFHAGQLAVIRRSLDRAPLVG